jgi:hypothetical protein
VDLGLGVAAQRDELGPVAHQLAQFPRGRWGDPRLGQAAHPQEVRQVGRVPHVVLDKAFTPSGWARCTLAPAAQYHPYVASSTTSGSSPARAITTVNRSTSLWIWTAFSTSPLSGDDGTAWSPWRPVTPLWLAM